MASATLSLCSSLALSCKISQKSQNPLLFNPNISFLSLSSHKLPLSSAIASQRPTFPFLAKSSESETAIAEAEPVSEPESEAKLVVTQEPAAAQIVEASSEPASKREEVFAVVMVRPPWVIFQFPSWIFCLLFMFHGFSQMIFLFFIFYSLTSMEVSSKCLYKGPDSNFFRFLFSKIIFFSLHPYMWVLLSM